MLRDRVEIVGEHDAEIPSVRESDVFENLESNVVFEGSATVLQ